MLRCSFSLLGSHNIGTMIGSSHVAGCHMGLRVCLVRLGVEHSMGVDCLGDVVSGPKVVEDSVGVDWKVRRIPYVGVVKRKDQEA